MNPHLITTKSGIRIGILHIQPPPTDLGTEAEAIQTALLRRPSLIRTKTPWWARIFQSIKGACK